MKKLLKTIIYILIGVPIFLVVILLLLWVDAKYLPWEDKKRERAFAEAFFKKVNQGIEKIYLKDLTEFEWDKVCYFPSMNIDGINIATPSEVIGREYKGYIPEESCDTMQHSDFLFFSDKDAKFIRFGCNVQVLCSSEEFVKGVECCSNSAFFTYKKNKLKDKEYYILNLNSNKEN